ncbi:hypothetical protein [Catenulispora subtropica]|uniref:Uncharacterized protein n=1 Tax=Catenulispora subtropica TaxID=450798 RepID=A0ABN2SD48_9ACTN
MSKNTKSSRETPDPNVVCAPSEVPNRRPAWGPARHASPGANVASGDTETALLAGAP